MADRSSTDSSSSPAETVTSSVTSSPFSYGLASRTARMASTSKDGGRPKTASAVPAAWRRTAAATVVVEQPGEEGREIRRLPLVGEVEHRHAATASSSSASSRVLLEELPLLRGDPARPLCLEVERHDHGRGPDVDHVRRPSPRR